MFFFIPGSRLIRLCIVQLKTYSLFIMFMTLGAWLRCFTEFIILGKPSTDTGPAIRQGFSTCVLHFVVCQAVSTAEYVRCPCGGDKRTTLNVESSSTDSSVGGNVAGFPLHPFISLEELLQFADTWLHPDPWTLQLLRLPWSTHHSL